MKKSLLILTVVLFSFFIITSCSEDPILTPPDKDSPQNALSMKMPTVDTTVTATPEAFFQLHNDLIPVNPDTTLTYVWEVVSSSSPSSNWVFSICNPMACVAPGTLRSEFSFTHGIPGYFWVDWSNKDTVLDSLKTGDCALTVRIFAKNGGDTLLYTTVMHVSKNVVSLNGLSMKKVSIDTTVTATPEAFFQLHNDLIPVNPDTTLTYVWEVVSSSSPSSNWVFSICNPMACVAPGTSRSEFSFTHGIPGYFWVDWTNKDTELDSLKTGDCALTVRIFAKNGGDTLLYTSVMHVTK